ncbi:histidine phosphatase family protein [Streptomyces viridiviolaceus]
MSVGGARAAGRGAGTAEPYAEVAEPATAAAAPGAGGVEPKGGVAVSVGGARAAGRGAGTAEPYAEVAEPATGAAAPYAAGVKPKGAAVASVGGAGGAGRGAGAAEREAEAAVPRPGAAVPDVGAGETGARAAKPAGEAVASVGDLEAVGEGATTPAARAGTAPATTPAARAGTAPATTPAARAGADVRAAKAVAAPGWGPPDLGAPATFVLLRHGETPLTPQKRFSGSGGSDPALSAVGREQAEKVAASLARRGTVQAIVSSPLARTRETAAVVAARLGLEVTVDEGLRETDFGAWEGLTFGEVRERYPDDLNAWLGSPDAEPTGGGESFAATGARIAATRDKLVAAYAGRTVLLVSHVTPIKTFVQLALGAPPESLFRMELSAASLSAVAYYADGGASVRLFNDTSHLR